MKVRNLHSVKLARYSSTVAQLELKTVSARDLFWVCRHGDSPIIIDPRPKPDHDVYSITGAISLPFDSVNIEDEIKTMPTHQPVYVHTGDNGEYEDESVAVAQKIKNLLLSTPVAMVRSGPTELRKSGFLYTCDWVNYEKREVEKKELLAQQQRK